MVIDYSGLSLSAIHPAPADKTPMAHPIAAKKHPGSLHAPADKKTMAHPIAAKKHPGSLPAPADKKTMAHPEGAKAL